MARSIRQLLAGGFVGMLAVLGLALVLSGPVSPSAQAQPAQCGDFATQSAAQTAFRADPAALRHLDPDGNGIICQDLPCPCDRVPPIGWPEQRQLLADLIADLEQYLGEQVALTAEIRTVLEPRAFVLGDADGDGDAQLLVLSDHDPAATIAVGQVVHVVGQLGRFDLAAFEAAVGGPLDDTPYADWDGRAVLVLHSVEPR